MTFPQFGHCVASFLTFKPQMTQRFSSSFPSDPNAAPSCPASLLVVVRYAYKTI